MDDQKVSSVPIHTFSVNSEMSKCLECSAAEKRYVNSFLLILLLFSELLYQGLSLNFHGAMYDAVSRWGIEQLILPKNVFWS